MLEKAKFFKAMSMIISILLSTLYNFSEMLTKIIKQHFSIFVKGNADYLARVKENNNYILNFTASWCGPCKAVAPILLQKQKLANGKWTLLKVDIDEQLNLQLNQMFQIQAVPTMIFFKDGKEVKRTMGGLSSQKLDDLIKLIS